MQMPSIEQVHVNEASRTQASVLLRLLASKHINLMSPSNICVCCMHALRSIHCPVFAVPNHAMH